MDFGMAYIARVEHWVHIDLNKDGSVAENSNLPACENGKILNVLAYKYLRRHCETACLSMSEGNLSAIAEMHLHEGCSFKESCSNMSFPVVDLQNQNFNTVAVKYICEEWGRTIFNMCDNPSILFSQPIELVAKYTQRLKRCLCFVFSGKFQIRINDLRLFSREIGNCSGDTLTINSNHFTCNETEPKQGSVFNGKYTEIMQIATVSLKECCTATMVALSLRPVEETILKCSAEKVIAATTIPSLKSESSSLPHRHDSSRHIEEPNIKSSVRMINGATTSSVPSSLYHRFNSSGYLGNQDKTEIPTVTTIILACTVAVLLAIICGLIIALKRKKLLQSGLNLKHERTAELQEQETIRPESIQEMQNVMIYDQPMEECIHHEQGACGCSMVAISSNGETHVSFSTTNYETDYSAQTNDDHHVKDNAAALVDNNYEQLQTEFKYNGNNYSQLDLKQQTSPRMGPFDSSLIKSDSLVHKTKTLKGEDQMTDAHEKRGSNEYLHPTLTDNVRVQMQRK